MTAPYAPKLISPSQRGGVDYTNVQLSFQHLAFTAGEAMSHYRIRRKELDPTPGSDEYWNEVGDSWGATTDNALAAEDGEVVTIDVTGTSEWASGETYEWAVETRNGSGEWSVASVVGVLLASTAPSLTVDLADPALNSRPTFNWLFSGGTGRSQRSFQFRLFLESTTNAVGFDASDPAWPVVWSTDPKFSGVVTSQQIEEDLDEAEDYELWGQVIDDIGLASGWVELKNFSTSYTPPAAPDMTVESFPSLGYVRLSARSQFNLIDADTGGFDEGLGLWREGVNTSIEWNSVDENMEITFAGMTFDELDSEYTDFDDETASIGTFADSLGERTQTYSLVHTPSGLLGIGVSSSVVYSAVCSIKPRDREVTAKFQISWYNSSGTFLSTSQGPSVDCAIDVNTDVYIDDATSPGTAAYARLEVVFYDPDNPVGEVVYMDNVAFAAASTVDWTPGGSNEGVGFVIQRSVDGGDFEYVWGASHDNPAGATGQGQDSANILDRALFLGNAPIQYKVYAVVDFLTDPKFSSPTYYDLPNGLNVDQWWLRSEESADCDLRIKARSFAWTDDTHTEVFLPTGDGTPIVLDETLPQERVMKMGVTLLSKEDRVKFQKLLDTKQRLFLQNNLGDGFFFRVIGKVSFQMLASVGEAGPQEVYRLNFSGVRVS